MFPRLLRDSLLKPRRDNFDHLDKNPPVDDVYFLESFVPPVYAAVDAIEMHRESHHPTVLDDADAFLYAFVELDLSTKKKVSRNALSRSRLGMETLLWMNRSSLS